MVQVVEGPIDVAGLIDAVRTQLDGAVVVFLGTVRELSRNRRVVRMEYEAYREMALGMLSQIEQQVAAKFGVCNTALVHRIGTLEPGEVIVAIVAASAHREEAFTACRYAIDRIKQIVPIWKKEVFEEGAEWVSETHPTMG
ncbi:MAG: molybdenum cofactor biosynthesis protein MoaE [Armatimonadota bacterium]